MPMIGGVGMLPIAIWRSLLQGNWDRGRIANRDLEIAPTDADGQGCRNIAGAHSIQQLRYSYA